jgi:uncharacterized protein
MTSGNSHAANPPAAAFTKEIFLQQLVPNVIAPAYAELDAKCRALFEAATALQSDPQEDALKQTRSCWLDAALSAEQLDCFKIGPVVDNGTAPIFYFCPIRPASVERAIGGGGPPSESQVEELGAAAKGLFALEYLLFPHSNPPPPLDGHDKGTAFHDDVLEQLSGPGGERRRLYLVLLAKELANKAQRLAREWQAPMSPSAVRFVEGGQASINTLIKQMVWCLENITERRLRPILAEAAGEKTSGPESQSAIRLILSSLEGIQRVYSGASETGLDDYLRHLGCPAADRFDQEYGNILAAVSELERHSESASREKLDQARSVYSSCHALELVIKVDLTSALGVTLTYSSIDGD